MQRASDVLGNGSSCLPPELHLLPLIQNPSSLKHWWPPRLPVSPGEPWWGSASREEVGCAPPIQQATGWGSCLCTPLPKGKVTFGCSQWRVQLHHCPWGWILLASPHPHATVMQLDPSTCWKAQACTAVVMLALGSWWDQGWHEAGGEAGAVSHGQGGCWRLAGPGDHHPAVGQARLAPRVGQGLCKDGL